MSNGRLDLWHPDESVSEGEKNLQKEKRYILAGIVVSAGDLWFNIFKNLSVKQERKEMFQL